MVEEKQKVRGDRGPGQTSACHTMSQSSVRLNVQQKILLAAVSPSSQRRASVKAVCACGLG